MSPLPGGLCTILGAALQHPHNALARDAWQGAFLMPLFQSGFLGEGQDGRDPKGRRRVSVTQAGQQ